MSLIQLYHDATLVNNGLSSVTGIIRLVVVSCSTKFHDLVSSRLVCLIDLAQALSIQQIFQTSSAGSPLITVVVLPSYVLECYAQTAGAVLVSDASRLAGEAVLMAKPQSRGDSRG